MPSFDIRGIKRLVKSGVVQRGRSMADLARAVGVTDSKLSNVLAGRRHAPDGFLADVFRQFLAWDCDDVQKELDIEN